MLDTLKSRGEPKVLILNNVDVTPKEELLTLTARLSERLYFEEIFMVSATTGDGVADLKSALAARMPDCPWHFPEEQVSDATDRMFAAELTREQLYHQLHAVLTSACAVANAKYDASKEGPAVNHRQNRIRTAPVRTPVL